MFVKDPAKASQGSSSRQQTRCGESGVRVTGEAGSHHAGLQGPGKATHSSQVGR